MRDTLLANSPVAAIVILYVIAKLWVVPKLHALEAVGETDRAKRIRKAIALGYFVTCIAEAVVALLLLIAGLLSFGAGLFCAAFMAWLGFRALAIFRRPERLDNTLLFGEAGNGDRPASQDGGITGKAAFRFGCWLRRCQAFLRRKFGRP